ncbi:type IV secretory system conjugative DNA transfer family protein [Nonomuraea ceibae]|uniref:type IV secretory system conjugative DNA transfer family protein n=1 Tax=Nonomuraea ceibae TaxID=1935170 RepID=UPI001C5F837E|nr:type IV secretory system conjugative DNA transfer family protein [Nonomuraea ceibae]
MSPDGRGSDPADIAPWLILTGMVAVLVLVAMIWLGGTLGALATGAGWHPPPFSWTLILRLADGTEQHWPGVPPLAVWSGIAVTFGATTALVVPAVMTGYRWLSRHQGLAGLRELRGFTPRGAAKGARRLRPSLSGAKDIPPDQAGMLLGEHNGVELRGSWEDVYLALMAPRSGKTTALVAPMAIRAPGAVLITSRKADAYTTTWAPRSSRGRLWVFDPQQIGHFAQDWWWDLLADAATVEGARRLAGHFIACGFSSSERGNYWALAAGNLLCSMFHAAATSGATIHDVLEWLANPADPTPVEALRQAGAIGLASQLQSTSRLPAETRGGVYDTAGQTVACLLDPVINKWITPASDKPQFSPEEFVTGCDTLYLFSKKGVGGAAPLVAAFTDAVLQAAIASAERAGGRNDPPVVPILDEAANIAPIEDLPDLYSFLGSLGIPVVTILQSYQQGARVWGQAGMDALWGAATIKILGAGLDDADFAAKISRLIGDHRIKETSVSHSRQGRSVSTSSRKERIYDAADVRALSKGTALLLLTGIRAAVIRLRPWMTEPYADRLRAATKRAEHDITRRAVDKHQHSTNRSRHPAEPSRR